MFSCAIIENKTKNKTNKQTNKQKPNKYNQALYTNYVSSILPGKIEGEESRFDIRSIRYVCIVTLISFSFNIKKCKLQREIHFS